MSALPIDRLNSSRLRLQYFEVVLQLIDHGTVSAAATAMGLTQPTVTRYLKELESQLGVTLFNRSNVGVTPTRVCRPVERLARELRDGLDEVAVLIQPQQRMLNADPSQHRSLAMA